MLEEKQALEKLRRNKSYERYSATASMQRQEQQKEIFFVDDMMATA